MLCMIVKIYGHASAGMRVGIASRIQHAEVYCVVLKGSALIGEQSRDMVNGRGRTERDQPRGLTHSNIIHTA